MRSPTGVTFVTNTSFKLQIYRLSAQVTRVALLTYVNQLMLFRLPASENDLLQMSHNWAPACGSQDYQTARRICCKRSKCRTFHRCVYACAFPDLQLGQRICRTSHSVNQLMLLHMTRLCECLVTHITSVWLFASMDTLELLQICSLNKGFVAHVTPVGLLTSMKHLVSLHSSI